MGRSIKLSSIGSVEGLQSRVALLYGFQASSVSIEMSYWIEDPIAELNGKGTQPVQIVCDNDVRVLKVLHSADKSVNTFVTVRERVGGSLVILGPKEGIATEIMRRRDCPQISDGKRRGEECSANGVGVETELTVEEIMISDEKRGGEECSANGVEIEMELTIEEIMVRDAEAFEADMERKAMMTATEAAGVRGSDSSSKTGEGVEIETAKAPSEEVVVESVDEKEKEENEEEDEEDEDEDDEEEDCGEDNEGDGDTD
ncbi:unnamed protein product [Microthlaspi erraticum]|uniref:Uncharacterized protein n=1 Tax=Microthlaspi erraticum TaxID=1685480 RepID=A0A6D2JMH6_9BRAS|nr:unnamed protein product [Microthlaspi erraticum]